MLYKAQLFFGVSEILGFFQRVKRFILQLRLTARPADAPLFLKTTCVPLTDYKSITRSWEKMGKTHESTKKSPISCDPAL